MHCTKLLKLLLICNVQSPVKGHLDCMKCDADIFHVNIMSTSNSFCHTTGGYITHTLYSEVDLS